MNASDESSRRTPDRSRLISRIAIVFLAIAVLVRLFNAFTYSPRWGHDTDVHLGYLRDLAHFHLKQTYNAPWYYLFTSGLALPALLPAKLAGCSEDTLARLALGISNTTLFLLCLWGVWQMSKSLGLSTPAAWAATAALGTYPVVARTFCMARPENLILALFPWAVFFLFRWLREADAASPARWGGRVLWCFSFATALQFAQKLSGAVPVATLLALPLLRESWPLRRRLGAGLRAALLVGVLSASLMFLHFALSGTNIFSHELRTNPKFKQPPLSFFFTLNPGAVWQTPARDALRSSMPNILLADLYGDYWGYGYRAGRAPLPPETIIARGRAGVILTALSLLCLGAAISAQIGPALRGHVPARQLLWCVSPMLLGLVYLGFAAIQLYCPEDGDIAKWEYIPWIFPCAAVLQASIVDGKPSLARNGILLASCLVAAGGLAQSLMWPH